MDRYEIRDQLGRGGVGAVFRAYDNQLKREVALKRLHPSDAESDTESLLQEARTLSTLMHPNIVTVFDVGQDEQGAFVVMELLEGETLEQTVERNVLTADDLREVVHQSLEALIAAQAANMMHRDLKPGNIMVIWRPSGKFQIKILDFGLAKISSAPSRQTIDQGDAIMGSIYFMAPEQFERVDLSYATDHYAMGCIYYYCLTGRFPFDGETAPQVMMAHLQNNYPPLAQVRPDLPPEMAQWVMWLMNRDPAARPQSAREALDRFPQPGSSLAPASPAAAPPAATPPGAGAMPRRTSTKIPLNTGPQTARPHQATGPHTKKKAAAGARPPARKGLPPVAWIGMASFFIFLTIGGILFAGKSADGKKRARVEQLAAGAPGGKEDVSLLLGFVSSDQKKSDPRALQLLSALDGPGVEAAIQAEVKEAKEEARRLALLQVIANKRLDGAFTPVLKIFQNPTSTRERTAAALTLSRIAGPGDVEALLDLLESPNLEMKDRQQIQGTVIQILRSDGNTAARSDVVISRMNSSSGVFRLSLAQILGAVGGQAALTHLKTIFSPSQKDKAYQQDAMRALFAWPNRGCLGVVQELMGGGSQVIQGAASDAFARLLLMPTSNASDVSLYDFFFEHSTSKDLRKLSSAISSRPIDAHLEYCKNAEPPGGGTDQLRKLVPFMEGERRKAVPVRSGSMIPVSKARLMPYGAKTAPRDGYILWDSPDTWFLWVVKITEPGSYQVDVVGGCAEKAGSGIRVTLAGGEVRGRVQKTEAWDEYATISLNEGNSGTLEFGKDELGVRVLYLHAGYVVQPKILSVRGVTLTKR